MGHLFLPLYRRKRGKLSIETQSRSPLKIKVHLEGEESLITELNDLVKKIWHERIDFSKISDRGSSFSYKHVN